MKRAVNYLRGTATLTARGLFPERLLNLCAQEGVACWALEWVDSHTMRLTTYRRSLPQLRGLAQRVGCEVEVEGTRGLPDFLARFRRRYAFLIGLAFALLAVSVLSRFILTVEVVGSEKVPTAQILSELRRYGVRPGAYGPGLDRKTIAQQALRGLEGLSWMSINLYGTRLEVVVRDAVEPPELAGEDGYYDIVAETDGLIAQVEPMAGEAAVQEGDTVAEGEVLISGLITMEPPKYSDLPVRTYQTHARGKVYARTWRTLSAAIPVQAEVKRFTGEERTLWSLSCLGTRLDFYKNSSIPWPLYDKITTVHQLTLPGGRGLPLMLRGERCRDYEKETVPIDLEAARTMLEERLLLRLGEVIGADGQVLSTQYSARVHSGMLEVTLTAECREEIGTEVPGGREIPGENPVE
ncbi:MAG: sporulation protein YqfD [Lawsonibacter sp.]|mgnify:FL=1|nr:sporulation protein YqfD [Oscillospiraceae bacterium]